MRKDKCTFSGLLRILRMPSISPLSVEQVEQYVTTVEDWDRLPADPCVSVFIKTYNHENFIADAIEGVLMQETDFSYEIIIVEDKSTDETREIVRDYQRRHSDKIRLCLAEENLYGKNTRYPTLVAWNAARGEYIAWHDGDDYWTDPQKLQKQADFLDDHPDCTICFTAAEILINESGKIEGTQKPDEVRKTYSMEYVLRRSAFWVSASTALRRSEIWDEPPSWFYAGIADDYCLLVLCAREGDVGYIDEKCAVTRMHEGGNHSSLDILEKLDRAVETREAILPDLDSHHRRVLEATIYSFNRKALKVAMNRTDASAVRKYARRCWNWVGRSSRKYVDVPLLAFLMFYHPAMRPVVSSLRKWKRKLSGALHSTSGL